MASAMQSIEHGTMGKMIVFDIRFSPSVSYSHSNEAQTRARARDDMPTCRILHSRGLQPAFASFERLVRRLPWMQRELLNSPIRDLAHEDFVFTPAVDFMDRAEFLQQLPCRAKFAQDSSVEGHLIDLPVVHRCAGVGVRRVKILRGAQRYANNSAPHQYLRPDTGSAAASESSGRSRRLF